MSISSNPPDSSAIWLLITGWNVLFMQAGFLALIAGASQAKNVKSVLLRSILDQTVGAIGWVVVGWGLFRGNNGFASGSDSSFYSDSANNALIFQQFGYCVTASAIIAGGLLGRCKLWITVCCSIITCTVAYPIVSVSCFSPLFEARTRKLTFLFLGKKTMCSIGPGIPTAFWQCSALRILLEAV